MVLNQNCSYLNVISFQALAEHEARTQQERKLRQAEECEVLEEKANADMAEAERKQIEQLEANKKQALREKEQRLAAIFESRRGDMTEDEQQHVCFSSFFCVVADDGLMLKITIELTWKSTGALLFEWEYHNMP